MSSVRRYEHGSRVPGWDEAADLDKDPAGIPDPALVEVPAALREEIEAASATMAGALRRRSSRPPV